MWPERSASTGRGRGRHRLPDRLGQHLLRAAWLLGALLPGAAAAEPGSPADCAGIESATARLACYDRFFQRGPADTRAADDAAEAAALLLAEAEETAASDASVEPSAAQAAAQRVRRWFVAGPRAADNTEVVPVETKAALANAGRGSLLDQRWELARDSKLGTFNLRAYQPVYALPMAWNARPNSQPWSPNPDNRVLRASGLQPFEAKFQLSFKAKIAENLFGDNGDLWAGYTQSSRWQMFNSRRSRPFRETDYEPELMLVFRNRYRLLGWNGRMTSLGINHQSNGRGMPESRSWNRVVATFGLDRDNWALLIRPWWRIPEKRGKDDNPDIDDYIGRGDVMLVYRHGDHEVATRLRHSLHSASRAHGALMLDWAFPLQGPLRGHVQLFHGYGESLIDYNHKTTYIGLGVSLLQWF